MTPLSVLDLAPVPAGGTARDALRNTLDLARRTEAAGYRRYWLAEHHLAPGVASAAPQVLIEAVAAATSRIRVGSGAVQTGHWTPLSIVEQSAGGGVATTGAAAAAGAPKRETMLKPRNQSP